MFSEAGFDMSKIHLKRNAPVAQLYEDAIKYEGAVIAASGALINFSGKKTGRSPKDKRIVYEETSKDDVWVRFSALLILPWKPSSHLVHVYSGALSTSRWTSTPLRSTASAPSTTSTPATTSTSLTALPACVFFRLPLDIDHHTDPSLAISTVGPQVPDQGPRHRFACLPRPLHAQQCVVVFPLTAPPVFPELTHAALVCAVLIRPTAKELEEFGTPDFTIYNAGQFPANRFTAGMTSQTSVEVNFKRREMVILGTEYAGEMKKGIFSVMHYLQPVKFGNLSLHSSANEGPDGDVSLFFGLSGTGKTTLSADPRRSLIGDDEHVWSDNGVFNIEGGCYAKCVGLDAEKEPEIYGAIKFGSILENVTYDYQTREPNYEDTGITENTRCAYPIE